MISVYFWLSSPEIAIKRVADRVRGGGHDIPLDIVKRRYYRGLRNLINLYIPICNNWIIIDNENAIWNFIAKGSHTNKQIINTDIWETILEQSKL